MIKFRYVNMNFRYKMHEIYKEALIISHQYLTISLNDDHNFKMKEEEFMKGEKNRYTFFLCHTDTRTMEILKNQDMIKFRYVNMNFRYKICTKFVKRR